VSDRARDFVCLAYHEGYICNRLPNHEGDHEATAWSGAATDEKYVAHRWPASASTQPKTPARVSSKNQSGGSDK
jgi:hypothetical protein